MIRTRFVLLALASLITFSAIAVAAQPDETQRPAEAEAAEAEMQTPPADPSAEGEEEEAATISVDSVVESFGSVYSETPMWAWGVLFAGILLGVVAGRVVQSVFHRLGKSAEQRGHSVRAGVWRDVAGPTSLAILTGGIHIGLLPVVMPEDLAGFAATVVEFFYILAIGWAVFNLVDLVEIAIERRVSARESALAAQVAPLIRKSLRIFVIIIFVLFVAQNVFGVDITAWLAGLGIAGLAISLASQDSVRNLFGSVTVMLDKPFLVGDRIVFDGTDGFVEEIGLRSTRIRTFTGHVVTVPNMRFIDGTVENVSSRPFFRRVLNVTITYDTSREKIEEAVKIIRDLLEADDLREPFHIDTHPPRVYFNDFNSESLNISVMYWYFIDESKGHDWWGFQQHGEKFNKRLFAAFAEAGIEFAFPTQTMFLAGDPSRALSLRVVNCTEEGR